VPPPHDDHVTVGGNRSICGTGKKKGGPVWGRQESTRQE
jgi:hypothetical protein